jgi:hypothetical protein
MIRSIRVDHTDFFSSRYENSLIQYNNLRVTQHFHDGFRFDEMDIT